VNVADHRFTLKFQQIVEQEQDANFISRLHRGKLQIIPWPVIETKGFYNLFSELKRGLDEQKISHPTGHEFLHTIKTLMAQLKVCLSQLRQYCDLTLSNRRKTGERSLVCYFITLSIRCSHPPSP
jgi:hypothetical protein